MQSAEDVRIQIPLPSHLLHRRDRSGVCSSATNGPAFQLDCSHARLRRQGQQFAIFAKMARKLFARRRATLPGPTRRPGCSQPATVGMEWLSLEWGGLIVLTLYARSPAIYNLHQRVCGASVLLRVSLTIVKKHLMDVQTSFIHGAQLGPEHHRDAYAGVARCQPAIRHFVEPTRRLKNVTVRQQSVPILEGRTSDDCRHRPKRPWPSLHRQIPN